MHTALYLSVLHIIAQSTRATPNLTLPLPRFLFFLKMKLSCSALAQQLRLQCGLVAARKTKNRSADAFWPCCAGSRALRNSGSVLRRTVLQRGKPRGESGRASLSRHKSAPDAAARRCSRPDGYLVYLAEAAGRERSHPNSPAKCGHVDWFVSRFFSRIRQQNVAMLVFGCGSVGFPGSIWVPGVSGRGRRPRA